MNLVKLEDDLKQLPEQTLVGYVQSPQNQVPTYLVLAELERRKRMKQGAMASMQQQNTTVADRMVAEAQPQQAPQAGVASLPVENIGDEAAYAAGGIVAFAEGGDPYSRALGESGWSEAYTKLPAAFKDIALSPLQFRWVRDPETGELIRAYEAEGWTPRLNQAEKNWSSMLAANELAAIQERSAKQFGVSPSQVSPTVAAIPNEFAPPTQPQAQEVTLPDGSVVNKAAYEQAMAAQNAQVPPGPGAGRDRGIRTPRIPTTPAPVEGIASLYEAPPNPWEDFTLAAAATAEDEMARMRSVLGVDPFQAKATEKLAAMEARAAKEEQTAPWMALAEAGFAIAGGESPYAATNIGKGAQKGIESLAKAKERAVAAEEKRFGIEADLARAKRAEDTAIASFGFNSEQADKQRKQREELEKRKGTADYETRVAENKFKDKQFQMEYKLKERELKQQAAIANKTPAEIQLIERYAKEAKIPFTEAFEAIQYGKRAKKMTDEEIAKVVLEKNPMIAEDPAAFKAAIQSFKDAISMTDYGAWGQPKQVK